MFSSQENLKMSDPDYEPMENDFHIDEELEFLPNETTTNRYDDVED